MIEHTNRSLDNSKQRFAHLGLRQAYNALNYQVNCWVLHHPKEPFYYQLSMPNNFHN